MRNKYTYCRNCKIQLNTLNIFRHLKKCPKKYQYQNKIKKVKPKTLFNKNQYKPFEEYNKKEIMNTKGKNLSPQQIHAIAERNRQIYEMKEIGEWTNREIAEKFNLSKEYIKIIYKRYKQFN